VCVTPHCPHRVAQPESRKNDDADWAEIAGSTRDERRRGRTSIPDAVPIIEFRLVARVSVAAKPDPAASATSASSLFTRRGCEHRNWSGRFELRKSVLRYIARDDISSDISYYRGYRYVGRHLDRLQPQRGARRMGLRPRLNGLVRRRTAGRAHPRSHVRAGRPQVRDPAATRRKSHGTATKSSALEDRFGGMYSPSAGTVIRRSRCSKTWATRP
jgi:hypothetical protein